eukprot:UN1015
MVKEKAGIPPPTLSCSEVHLIRVQDVDLTIMRTFLNPVEDSSDLSRQTRSTGDRPKHVPTRLSATSEDYRLPPRGADYGPLRKKFQLLQTDVAIERTRAGVEDAHDAVDETLSQGSYQTCVTSLSFNSLDFHDAVSDDCAVIEHLAEELDGEVAALQRAFPDGEMISLVEVRAHFMNGAALLRRFIGLLFERAPPPPADLAALSARESPQAMDKAIKVVGMHLGRQVLKSLCVLTSALNIPSGSILHFDAQRFRGSLGRSFAKAATKQLQQDVHSLMRCGGVVHLDFLQTCILRVLDDVLHQQLNDVSASLLRAAAKHSREQVWTASGTKDLNGIIYGFDARKDTREAEWLRIEGIKADLKEARTDRLADLELAHRRTPKSRWRYGRRYPAW